MGGRVDPNTLPRRHRLEARSKMRRPVEQPSESDLQLWHDGIMSLCPSRRGMRPVGPNIGITHRVWRWFWDDTGSSLHHTCSDGTTEDVYVADCKPDRFRFSHNQTHTKLNFVCSVQQTINNDQCRGSTEASFFQSRVTKKMKLQSSTSLATFPAQKSTFVQLPPPSKSSNLQCTLPPPFHIIFLSVQGNQ